jgi:hypothetical protein
MSNPTLDDYYKPNVSKPPPYSSSMSISHPNEGHYASSASAYDPMSMSGEQAHPNQSHYESGSIGAELGAKDDFHGIPTQRDSTQNPDRWFDGECVMSLLRCSHAYHSNTLLR